MLFDFVVPHEKEIQLHVVAKKKRGRERDSKEGKGEPLFHIMARHGQDEKGNGRLGRENVYDGGEGVQRRRDRGGGVTGYEEMEGKRDWYAPRRKWHQLWQR